MVKSLFGNNLVHRFARYQLKCPYYYAFLQFYTHTKCTKDHNVAYKELITLIDMPIESHVCLLYNGMLHVQIYTVHE